MAVIKVKRDGTWTEVVASAHVHNDATTSTSGFMSAEDKNILENLSMLVGETKVSDQIDDAINALDADDVGIYVQSTEPMDPQEGDLWLDLNESSSSINADTLDGMHSEEFATAEHTHDEYAPAYDYGTTDLIAGSSSLATGKLYFVYE